MLACVCGFVGIYILLSSSEVGANRQQRTFLDCSGTVNSLLACNNIFFFGKCILIKKKKKPCGITTSQFTDWKINLKVGHSCANDYSKTGFDEVVRRVNKLVCVFKNNNDDVSQIGIKREDCRPGFL